MTLLLSDLPPEILISIFEVVGWSNRHYNDREQLADLARLCLVNSHFLDSAIRLLYSNLAIRNSGRANILANTLEKRLDLRHLPQKLSFRSDSDKAHPVDLKRILSLVEPDRIDLGSRLFSHGDASIELREVLMKKKSLKSFSYGTSQWAISKAIDLTGLQSLIELLPSFAELEELALRNCATASKLPPSLEGMPVYNLTKLEFVNVDLHIEEFIFFLANSKSLQHLTLNKLTILKKSNLTELSDLDFKAIQEADFLALLAFKLSELKSLELVDIDFNFNSILELAPNIQSLHLACSINKEFTEQLELPDKLVDLRIDGTRYFSKLELFNLVEPPDTLQTLLLVGVLKTDLAATEFEERRRKRGWNFEVIYKSIYS